MNKFSLISNNGTECIEFGKKFSKKLIPGCTIGLIGELATGKTTFVKGILEGLGYKYTVSSPTFTLINNYEAKLKVMHVDFYREPKIKRWIDIGFKELILDSDIVLIEWADLIPEILPDNTTILKFEHYKNNKRKIYLI